MPRPVKPRTVSPGLAERVFRPARRSGPRATPVRLTLDGLEALRLADLEGLYHEEAARRMGISRATFARVLADARGTVADALVHGRTMAIRGGDVATRARDERWPCPVHQAGARRGRGCRCVTPVPGKRGRS